MAGPILPQRTRAAQRRRVTAEMARDIGHRVWIALVVFVVLGLLLRLVLPA